MFPNNYSPSSPKAHHVPSQYPPILEQFPYSLSILLMWLGDYGVSRPKLNLSRWDRTALHPVKSPTHRNSPNFPKRLQTSLITTANNRIGLLTKLVEVRLHLIGRGFLTDPADKNLLRLVGLRFWLWSRVLWVDLLSIEGVRRNGKDPVHCFRCRESDEAEASAPLKICFVEEGQTFFGFFLMWLVHLE